MNHGNVYWCTFSSPDKRRPVVILTRDSAIGYLSTVTVGWITSSVRGVPSEVPLSPDDGMPDYCAANLYNIQTVQKVNLGPQITHLSHVRMIEIRKAIEFVLGFDALVDPEAA